MASQAQLKTLKSLPSPAAAKMKKLLTPLTIFISLPALAGGIWILFMRGYTCEELLRMPPLKITIGIGMIIVFFVSNAVVVCGHRVLIPGLLVLTVLLMVMLMLGLALSGAYSVESRAVPATPMWLRIRVSRNDIWNNIKTCLYDTKICSDLEFRTIGLASYDFSMIKLSPVESGCCNPPDLCGMEYVNATFWIASKGYSTFSDCNTWSNQRNELCYNCHSCKTGFFRIIEHQWRQVGIFLILMAILFMVAQGARFILMMSERQNT